MPTFLTKQDVADVALPAGRAEVTEFDDRLPGFGVRLRASGKRYWILQYRMKGLQRKITLGSTDKLTPERAFHHAQTMVENAGLARSGLAEDPAVARARA